jgi:DMSO/TMAO reductase YedYZ molybdopterin-dependent catalytic subunit
MKAGCTISFIGPVPEAALHSSRGVRRRRPTDADAARVPPGQQVVNDLPVLSVGPTPSVRLRAVDLYRHRAANQSRSWTWNAFTARSSETLTVDVHSATKWSKLDTEWAGVSVDVLTDRTRTAAKYLTAYSYGE